MMRRCSRSQTPLASCIEKVFMRIVSEMSTSLTIFGFAADEREDRSSFREHLELARREVLLADKLEREAVVPLLAVNTEISDRLAGDVGESLNLVLHTLRDRDDGVAVTARMVDHVFRADKFCWCEEDDAFVG